MKKEEDDMKDIDHCDWKLALQELVHGQDVAAKLCRCLNSAHEDEDGKPAPLRVDLAGKLVESFTSTISLLGYCGGAGSDGASRLSASTTSPDPERTDRQMDGRGRYKRRKSCHSWSKTAPALIDDGHAWRKYGQKSILNSDFPRSYFRCTHKFEQNCQATKQVQRISGDPPLYQTTYYGHHTCKNTFESPQFILEELDSFREEGTPSNLVRFDGCTTRNAQESPFFSSAFLSKSSGVRTYGRNESLANTRKA